MRNNMEKFKVFYEKNGNKDCVFLYADSKEEAERKIKETFGSVGYKVTGVEALGTHLTKEKIMSK